MRVNKIINALTAFVLVFATAFTALAAANVSDDGSENKQSARGARVRVPLNLAVLIQDDLTPRVGNEIGRTREFIRQLPEGSRVMVGYITTGTLQVRQEFTTDLERAAKALRIPVGTSAASSFNPYVEVREALKKFPTDGRNANAMLLVSDGLDTSRGFDFSSSVTSIDLDRAVKEARLRGVAVYSFYAPAVLTASSRTATQFGQGALNRLTKETGGRAFFQGFSFVSFDPYFNDFSRALNQQYAGAI